MNPEAFNAIKRIENHLKLVQVILQGKLQNTSVLTCAKHDHTADKCRDEDYRDGGDSPPSFDGPQGCSWIDLALAMNIHPDRIQEWNIADRITMSDHQIMDLLVMGGTQDKNKRSKKWKISEEVNFFEFMELNKFERF
ncbi:hypothetical protein AVEN_112901-1 [Araneus ventricosus]|uniref:Endonuclease/exonuclease/phosphatase domain-containing protein n=1 Tax=Araneus ventricosus TaxID=182803 RepID=A0A4Y2VZP0_ARAVE|nr:hypothetical protein AVEN_112901-1 [Araneus ventricosus]